MLAMKSGNPVPVRTPSLGLFLDLEIRLNGGPVFVDEPYTIAREIVGLSQSRKTESYWTRTTLTDQSGRLVATVLLHSRRVQSQLPRLPQGPPRLTSVKPNHALEASGGIVRARA